MSFCVHSVVFVNGEQFHGRKTLCVNTPPHYVRLSFVEPNTMEVFQTENFYIFVRKETSLWWNRSTSEFTVKAGT